MSAQFEAAVDAVISGDVDTLRGVLSVHSDLVRARSDREHQATLLHYVAANGVEDDRQKTPPNAVEIARMLLDAGAEADATFLDGKSGTTPLASLVTSVHPHKAGVAAELVRTFVAGGAKVNGLNGDGEPLRLALKFGYRASAETLATIAGEKEERVRPDIEITLREVTSETVLTVCSLSHTLTPPRRNFVAPNAVSIAQAHFSKTAWFRAIYAGETPVGFLMLDDDVAECTYFLWRFMVAQPYHGLGFGRAAIDRLVDYVKTRPEATELQVSCGQGEGSPEGFYVKYGFRHDGTQHGREIGLTLTL